MKALPFVALGRRLRSSKVAAGYENWEKECIGFHEDAHLISFTINRPPCPAITEGLAMYFDRKWWGIQNMDWTGYYLKIGRYIGIDMMLSRECFFGRLQHYISHYGSFHRLAIITWSTDGFFRETKEKVAYRKSEGCSVVEMECSALAAVSTFRGATWDMILYTADSLADVEKYDERNWGGNAYEYALTLCLDAVLKL